MSRLSLHHHYRRRAQTKVKRLRKCFNSGRSTSVSGSRTDSLKVPGCPFVASKVSSAVGKKDIRSGARQRVSRLTPETDLLVLDGIPRNIDQATIVDDHIDVLRIIHLKAPDIDEMVQRMKRRAEQQARTDDADESVIRRRFEVYETETSPVLEHYDARLITDIDALGTPIEVLLHVLEVVAPIYNANGFGNPLG